MEQPEQPSLIKLLLFFSFHPLFKDNKKRIRQKNVQNKRNHVTILAVPCSQRAKKGNIKLFHDVKKHQRSLQYNNTPQGAMEPASPFPLAYAATHSLLLWRPRWGGGRQALLAVHQFAVGLPQGSLQLVDAGLVLQQEVLRLIQKLQENVQEERREEKKRKKNKAENGREKCISKTSESFWEAVLASAHLIRSAKCNARYSSICTGEFGK